MQKPARARVRVGVTRGLWHDPHGAGVHDPGPGLGRGCRAGRHDRRSIQKVSIEKLQAKLKAQKAVLSPDELPKSAAADQRLDASKLAGIIVDDEQATKTGDWATGWVRSTSVGPFVGEGYLHDNNQNKGKMRIRFTPKLPQPGKYEVRIVYSPHANRATNVPVIISSSSGEKKVTVNQRQVLPGGRPVALGVFEFEAGEKGWVEVRNDGTDGIVIADAVQFLRRD